MEQPANSSPLDPRAGGSDHRGVLRGTRMGEVVGQREVLGHKTEGRADDPLVGTLIAGKYRVIGVLGKGGVGVVYEARHETLGREAAIKVLSANWSMDETAVRRFQREARSASGLGHPNIVDVYDFGELDDGRPYLIMERLHGESLADVLQREGRMSPARVGRWIRKAAAALDIVHAQGIVHRDIKPDNLIIATHADGSRTLKLVDFGLASLALRTGDRDRLTRHGMIFGTPEYLAPECGDSDALDLRADIYSLGVTAFELLCGVPPFEGTHPAKVLLQKRQKPAPNMRRASGIPFPYAVEAVLSRALARNPEQRYPSAGEFASSLSRALRQMDARVSPRPRTSEKEGIATRALRNSSTPPSRSHVRPVRISSNPRISMPPAQPNRRRRLIIAATSLLGLLVAAGGAVAAYDFLKAADSPVPPARSVRTKVATSEAKARIDTKRAATKTEAAAPKQEAVAEAPTLPLAPPATSRASEQLAGEAAAPTGEKVAAAQGVESPTPTLRHTKTRRSRESRRVTRLRAHVRARLSRQLVELGSVALEQKNLQEAEAAFRDATHTNPNSSDAWRGLGKTLDDMGRSKSALRAYRRYLRLVSASSAAEPVRERVEELKR